MYRSTALRFEQRNACHEHTFCKFRDRLGRKTSEQLQHARTMPISCVTDSFNNNNTLVEVRTDQVNRRALLSTVAGLAAVVGGAPARAADIDILAELQGTGSRGARRGDLLLFHYVGRLESTGQVFDSTRGGLTYRDGGLGVFRPAAIALGGGPVPGICQGLQRALEGMSIGGKRTVRVPAALGFGSQTVLAPYGVVPANSTLLFEVELLRLSAVGPDQLTKGIFKCGAGGANNQSENCENISYAEFL